MGARNPLGKGIRGSKKIKNCSRHLSYRTSWSSALPHPLRRIPGFDFTQGDQGAAKIEHPEHRRPSGSFHIQTMQTHWVRVPKATQGDRLSREPEPRGSSQGDPVGSMFPRFSATVTNAPFAQEAKNPLFSIRLLFFLNPLSLTKRHNWHSCASLW